MSFNILLYINSSESNRLDKELSSIATLSGVLKSGSSIINPTILIEASVSSISTCNYFYIAEFGRYYFMRDMVSIQNGLIEISGHVDVLTSFKSAIRTNTAITRRQSYKWNLYLDDGSFKTYQNPIVVTKSFPNGFNTQEFVLAVAGS